MRYLAEVGVEVRVLRLSGAKDPDEYIKKFGKESFHNMLSESKGSFDYKLDKVIISHDITQPQGLLRASAEICSIIAGTYSSVEREIYISTASKRLGISVDSLKADVERIQRQRQKEQAEKQSKEAYMSVKSINDRVNPDASKNIKASAAEEAVLGLMLIFPECRNGAATGKIDVSEDDFSTSFGKRVFSAICELERTDEGFSKAMLGQVFSLDEISRIESIEQKRSTLSNSKEMFETCVQSLKQSKSSGDDDILAMFEKKRLEAKKLRESKASK